MFYCFLIFFIAFIGALIFLKVKQKIFCRKLKTRFQRASDGERRAEKLLLNSGYKILQKQKKTTLCMWVDNEKHFYDIRPDLVVYKRGRKYLVEVKTGQIAVDPTFSNTRRQLLEYYYSFHADGVLLVNAEEDEIRKIHFHTLSKDSKLLIKYLVVFSIGFLFAIILR